MSSLTDQQRRAVESIDQHVLVSAGAGSGKTQVLVERYLEILSKSPDLTVSSLVAVTYTKKAANEMRTRLKRRMQELIHNSSGPTRDRWIKNRGELDSARIGTIHSLCESLLKSSPAEAGLDPQFSVLDDLERAEMLNASIEQSLRELIASLPEEHQLLLSYPPDQIKAWVATLMKSALEFQGWLERLNEIKRCSLDESLRIHAEAVLVKLHRRVLDDTLANPLWTSALNYLSDHPWMDSQGKLEQHRLDLIRLAKGIDLIYSGVDASDANIHQAISWLVDLSKVRARTSGGQSDQAIALREQITVITGIAATAVKGLPLALNESDALAIKHMSSLIRLTQRALSHYNESKHLTQKLDFNDLIWRTHQLLNASTSRHHHREVPAHILVDEFQDTNTVQSELIFLLSGPDTRLFLIGDDKQSIYKFQGADVSNFNAWRQRLSNLEPSGLLLSLTTSFRSHQSIVRFTNNVFERLLSNTQMRAPYRAKPLALASSRQDSSAVPRIEMLSIDARNGDSKADTPVTHALEARAVAAWIGELIASGKPVKEKTSDSFRPIRWGDCAVLVKRNRDFAHVEQALSERGIPYVTMAGNGFLDRQEIYDMENVLRFLWQPTDNHSLLGALRSPMFGISDDVIHRMASGGQASLWQRAQECSAKSEPGYEMLARCVSILKDLLREAATRPLGEVVNKIITVTNYDLVLMPLRNGHQRSRNLLRFLSLAIDHSHLSLGEFTEALNSMRELSVKQSDAPMDALNSVRLMTIHGSKGLEFPAVALPALSSQIKVKSSKLLFDREYGMSLNTRRDNANLVPSLFDSARLIEKDMLIAEGKRLLYVAITRARDYLGLFLNNNAPKWDSFGTWLSAIANDISEPSTGSISGTSGEIFYKIRPVTLESIGAWEKSTAPHAHPSLERTNTADTGVDSCISNLQDDLLPPLPGTAVKPTWNWQRLLRVTPSSKKVSLNPTVTGQYFHALMESLPEDLAPASQEFLLYNVSSANLGVCHPDMIKALLNEGQTLMTKFHNSTLYQLMRTARRRLHEVPYVVACKEVHRSGRIDLLLEDSTGQWHIIDYKTDHFEPADADHQALQHRKQLEEYAGDIEQLTGIRPRTAIYFAQHGLLYDLKTPRMVAPG